MAVRCRGLVVGSRRVRQSEDLRRGGGLKEPLPCRFFGVIRNGKNLSLAAKFDFILPNDVVVRVDKFYSERFEIFVIQFHFVTFVRSAV